VFSAPSVRPKSVRNGTRLKRSVSPASTGSIFNLAQAPEEAPGKEELPTNSYTGSKNGEGCNTEPNVSYHDSSTLQGTADDPHIGSHQHQTSSPFLRQFGNNELQSSNEGNSQSDTTRSPRPRPSNRHRPSTSTIDRDVMDTVVSSSKDALGILFKAAEHQDTSEDSSVVEENAVPPYQNDSPGSTLLYAPVPLPPSALSKPAQSTLDVWDAFRFVRQGWFTAREAVTYIDL
jgi:hypothetical protein